ncbi:MAG: DUF928 domain-containing protein [Merismopedia sp. SIO2A8]|nr:DUF928 domain-containing protein [Merismopedia sp. SIO2A8]
MSKHSPLKAMLAIFITANGVLALRPTIATVLQPLTSAQSITSAQLISSPITSVQSLSTPIPPPRSLAPSSVNHNGRMLVAGLPFRLPIRASRWRFGAFARGCNQGVRSAYLSAASRSADVSEDTRSFQALQTILTPITPPLQESEGHQGTPVDHTLTAHPIVFLRMPSLPGGTVDFTVQNEAGTEQLYEATFELTTQEEGIVGIQIPETALPLEVGQIYAWQVMVTSSCPQPEYNFRLHTGSWIERVAADEGMATIEQVEMRDRLPLYAEAGLWIDTLSTLAQLRWQYPNDADLNESWTSLMESVDLSEFATKPILHIYSSEPGAALGE